MPYTFKPAYCIPNIDFSRYESFYMYMFFVSEKPSKPVGPLKVDDITEDQVKLSWKPPESDGGSKITSYIVEKCEARHPRWLRVARLPPGSLSVDCYNLIEGMDYFFSVAAENEAGVSSPLETDKPVTPKSKFGMYTKCSHSE